MYYSNVMICEQFVVRNWTGDGHCVLCDNVLVFDVWY